MTNIKNQFYLNNVSIVGKLLRNTPKGLQPTSKAALKSQEPSFDPPSMVQLDSATIEKMLNQNKDLSDGDDKNHDTNMNCVPLPTPENCSHSDDPMCHDEGISFNIFYGNILIYFNIFKYYPVFVGEYWKALDYMEHR